MSLANAPGPWRWERRDSGWWRVNDALRIEDGPHRAPHVGVVSFLGADLIEPATIGGLTLDDPPTWLVRVRFTVDGQEAVVAWRFRYEQAARDLLEIAEADPETVVVMAADMITQDGGTAGC